MGMKYIVLHVVSFKTVITNQAAVAEAKKHGFELEEETATIESTTPIRIRKDNITGYAPSGDGQSFVFLDIPIATLTSNTPTDEAELVEVASLKVVNPIEELDALLNRSDLSHDNYTIGSITPPIHKSSL